MPTSSPPSEVPSIEGSWSFEDVDLAVPTLLSKAEADAAMRVVLEDYGHYATGRKPREGEDALLVLDEFSALASGVDRAINLAERVRDVGVQSVVAAQSVEGLGDHRQAPRLLASCAGGVVLHQWPGPGAATGAGWDGPDPGAQLGAGLLRPGGWPRPGWGSGQGSTPSKCDRPSRRGLG
jgi:hypothetical protein